MTELRDKKQKPYRRKRFGIINHLGGIWSPETFVSAMSALSYLNDQRSRWPDGALDRHRIVPVCVTISEIKRHD